MTFTRHFLGKDREQMTALELCSGVFYATMYEASKREEVYAKQQGSVCYFKISAAQPVRSFVYGNGKS